MIWDSLGGWVFFLNPKLWARLEIASSGAAEPESLNPKAKTRNPKTLNPEP